MKNRIRIFDYIPSFISLVGAIGVMTFFSACGLKADGSWMRCHSVQIMAFVIFLALTVIMVFPVFISNKIVRAVFYIAGIALCIVLFLLPGIIKPLCMMQTMRCYTVMQPCVRLFSFVDLFFIASLLIKNFVKSKNFYEE